MMIPVRLFDLTSRTRIREACAGTQIGALEIERKQTLARLSNPK
jgi:hypothetical protein